MVRIDIQRFVGNNELWNEAVFVSEVIKAMATGNDIEIYTEEIISAIDIGLIDTLNSLVSHHKWDRNRISLRYNNHKEHQLVTEFKVSVTNTGDPIARRPSGLTVYPMQWDKSKYFGMFIGRINVTRLCAIENLQTFKYKDAGLTSMNQDPSSMDVNTEMLLQYFKESDCSWSFIETLKPYSDISEVIRPPIKYPKNFVGWEEIYKQIPIEIICETSDSPNCWAITEKLSRCIMYKRPFLLISSPGLAKQLSTHSQMVSDLQFISPLMLFGHVIPLNYDNLAGKERVDAVFAILEDLISTGKIETIIEDCAYDIEHNHEVMSAYLSRGFNKDGL